MNSFDLIVVGAGPGGYSAALKAAELGMSVAVVERGELGGTCLNRGCMPAKTLLHAAELLRELRSAASLGVGVGEVTVNAPALFARRDAVVAQLRSGIDALLTRAGITQIKARASIDARQMTLTAGGEEYSAKNILVATGSVPALPPIEGIEADNVFSGDSFVAAAKEIPADAVVIGGGVIGVELTEFLLAVGSRVTVIEAAPRLLPTMDRELSQAAAALLKKRGAVLYTDATAQRVAFDKVEFCCKQQQLSAAADTVIVAAGRRADISGLFTGDSPRCARGITVDENGRTSLDGIWAVGDVSENSFGLAHAAAAQGINAVCAMAGLPACRDLSVMPAGIYTSPEIAFVGCGEQQAKEQGIAVVCGKAAMGGNGRTVIAGGERGFVKLIFAAADMRFVGARLMCERATDIVGELSLAIARRLTASELAASVHAHPTFSEAVAEAAEAALRR